MMTQSQMNLAIRLSEILGWNDIHSHIVLPAMEKMISKAERMGYSQSLITLSKTRLWEHIANSVSTTPSVRRTICSHTQRIEGLMRKGISFNNAYSQILNRYAK